MTHSFDKEIQAATRKSDKLTTYHIIMMNQLKI